MTRARTVLSLVLLAGACGGEAPGSAPSAPAPDAAYLAGIESWRAERMEGLRRPDGWLSLVGLYWLEEGVNTLGADPANDLVFPAGQADAKVGLLHRSGRQVRFEAAASALVSHDGEPVTNLDLVSDVGGEPTTLEHRSLSFYVIERGERVGLRLKDRESELLREFAGIDHYPVDPAWRLAGRFEPFAEPKMIPVPNITGDVIDQPSHGRIVFVIGGAEYSLKPLGEPDGKLFLVFGDETNGAETYGGGRFLYTEPPAADGRLTVDFNKAYNPPCVFTPYATCPLPPPGNRLPLEVLAGEKNFGAAH